ncbi:MAG TPA: hypothetical protein VEB40_06360 [Flavipsychrobacter sp.]|nr:hypothetical protein [Flavipsychrobacter sp.]
MKKNLYFALFHFIFWIIFVAVNQGDIFRSVWIALLIAVLLLGISYVVAALVAYISKLKVHNVAFYIQCVIPAFLVMFAILDDFTFGVGTEMRCRTQNDRLIYGPESNDINWVKLPGTTVAYERLVQDYAASNKEIPCITYATSRDIDTVRWKETYWRLVTFKYNNENAAESEIRYYCNDTSCSQMDK